MHFPHQLHLLDDGTAVDLQAAAIIVQSHAGDLADQNVGAPGRDLPQNQRIASVLPPADKEVEPALFYRRDHVGNVRRIVLEVAVERRDQPAGGRVDSRLHCGCLTEILLELDDLQLQVGV